jgi:transketolase
MYLDQQTLSETLEAWELALKSKSSPSVLALTRQDLPMVRKENLKKI